jgi:O-antigen/teichoic acid export membrane protein
MTPSIRLNLGITGAATLVTAGVSFLTVPLATLRLGPAEYGVYAMGSMVSAAITMIAGMSANLVLAAHVQTEDPARRRALLSTAILLTSGAAATLAGSIAMGWHAMAAAIPVLRPIPFEGILLLLAGSVASMPWVIAGNYLVYTGGIRAHATASVVQSLVGAAALLVSLFVFDAGGLALFIGAGVAALMQGVFAASLLRRHIGLVFDPAWARAFLTQGGYGLVAGTADATNSVIERSLLSSFAGLQFLGIYAHSQQYRTALDGVGAAIARSVIPVTLGEAREEQRRFSRTGRVWRHYYGALICLGIVCALIGREAIGLLTHGKFSDAAPWVTAWVVYQLIAYSGRPQLGFVLAHGHGRAFSLITALSKLTAMLCLMTLVPTIGAGGAMVAAFAQIVVVRLTLAWWAARKVWLPIQDGLVVLGGGAVLGTLAVVEFLSPAPEFRLATTVVVALAGAVWLLRGQQLRFA